MASFREKLDWLRLARTPEVGPATFAQLIARFGAASSALEHLPRLAHRAQRLRAGAQICPTPGAGPGRSGSDRGVGAGPRHRFRRARSRARPWHHRGGGGRRGCDLPPENEKLYRAIAEKGAVPK